MARSVRTRPDPGQLTFLVDLDVHAQPAVAAEHEVRAHVVSKPEPEPPPPPAREPASAAREPEPEPHGAAFPQGSEPDWRAVLDFERGWSGSLPAKQRAVRDRFGVPSARYHQVLDRALELPDALTYDPALVARLRRIRETRRSKRFARRVDASGASQRGRGASGEEGPTGG